MSIPTPRRTPCRVLPSSIFNDAALHQIETLDGEQVTVLSYRSPKLDLVAYGDVAMVVGYGAEEGFRYAASDWYELLLSEIATNAPSFLGFWFAKIMDVLPEHRHGGLGADRSGDPGKLRAEIGAGEIRVCGQHGAPQGLMLKAQRLRLDDLDLQRSRHAVLQFQPGLYADAVSGRFIGMVNDTFPHEAAEPIGDRERCRRRTDRR